MIPGETIQSQKELGLPKNPHHGDFKVMRSAGGAGYYIGTMFLACGEKDCKDCAEYVYGDRVLTKGTELDYNSRETDYFQDREQAEAALATFKDTGELPGERY